MIVASDVRRVSKWVRGEPVSMFNAAHRLRTNWRVMRNAAARGFVPGAECRGGKYYAKPEAWERGLEAYREWYWEKRFRELNAAKGAKPIEQLQRQGLVSAQHAANILRVGHETMRVLVHSGFVRAKEIRTGNLIGYYAPLEEWVRALKRWRQASREERRAARKSIISLRRCVDDETLRRRMAEWTPERRRALHFLILVLRATGKLPRGRLVVPNNLLVA